MIDVSDDAKISLNSMSVGSNFGFPFSLSPTSSFFLFLLKGNLFNKMILVAILCQKNLKKSKLIVLKTPHIFSIVKGINMR